MKKLWNFGMGIYHQYEEVLNYLIFGFLAFVVNYIVYAVCVQCLDLNYQVGNLISWIVAVIFAYWTNRTFVFKSKVVDKVGVLKEITSFASARVATLVLEVIVMWLFVDILFIHEMFAKLVGQFIVIVTNYVFSKLFIFKKSEK